ncbi:hypothetical protein [Caniella muris]|uniref:hypothetical protein n=1 Tax=Caniella muris TaxID=2941502 RepID=UPI00203E7B3D|nr:hypothetical protein [Caniella muris]
MGHDDMNGAIARPGRRPILNAGIALCAAVVVSLVVLTCALADPAATAGEASVCSLACMVVAYAVPCVAGMVVVIMRDICVPRRLRYAMAAASFGFLCFIAAFPTMGAIALPATETARQLDAFSSEIVRRGTWLIVLLGLAMGFAMPVSTRAKDGPALRAPRRRLIQATLACLLWMTLSFQLAFAVMASDAGILAMGPAVTFVTRSTCVPLGAFLLTSLVVSWLWGLATFGYPSWLPKLLFWAPLAVMAVLFVSDVLDVLQLHTALSVDFNDYRLSDVGIVYTTILGILFGVGLSAVDD